MTMRGSIRRWTEVSTREVLQIQERSYSLVWIIGCCSNNCINEKSQREPPMHTMNSILIHPLFKYKQPNPFVLHNRKMLRKDHRHYPWETLKGKGQTTSNLSAIVSQENVSQRVYEQNVPLLRQFLHQTSSIFCIKSFEVLDNFRYTNFSAPWFRFVAAQTKKKCSPSNWITKMLKEGVGNKNITSQFYNSLPCYLSELRYLEKTSPSSQEQCCQLLTKESRHFMAGKGLMSLRET